MSIPDDPVQGRTLQWDPDERLCPECGRTFPAGTDRCPDDGSPLEPAHPFLAGEDPGGDPGELAGERVEEAEADGDRLVGTTLLEKWRVVRKLGAGSYGTVYEVEDLKGGWREALKVLAVDRLSGAEAENARKRFLREAQIMKRLGTESPHIVGLSTYDEDLEAGLIYFTMEFVEGRTLADVLEEEGPFPLDRAVRTALQVCEALMVAHEDEEQVVHRDLKLENLMLTTDRSGEETIKILDFGIAKIAEKETDSRLTTVGTLGTPGYAAPEQLRAGEVDGRTDLFAFGVILYGLLTGRDPWLGFPANEGTTQIYDLMVKSERGEVRPMSDSGTTVPPEMEAIVMKLLQRDPEERFQSARQLRAALREVEKSAATAGAFLRVRTEEPGVRVEVRSGMRTVAEGHTPLVARGLDPGTYRVRIRDERFEPVESKVSVPKDGRGDVTLVVRPRSTGLAATLGRNRWKTAAAVLVLLAGAGVALVRPWGTTLEVEGLLEHAAAGDVTEVRLADGGVAGSIDRGVLPPLPFRAPVASERLPGTVEALRDAGVRVDPSAEVRRLLDEAARAQAARRYFDSGGDDVRSLAQRITLLDPGNEHARALLWKVAERMAWDAEAVMEEEGGPAARPLVQECLALVPDHAGCTALQESL